MNKILLDFGANKGQGLKKMIDIHQIDKEWIIYSFEPNPNLFKIFNDNFKDINLNIHFNKKAVWKNNGEINFSIMNENDEGSSIECLISENRASDPGDPCFRKHDNIIKVECIDILDILDKFNVDDFIIIKMDIEGAEFQVLRRLLESKENCKKIKYIYIEWHTCYVKGENQNTEDDILFRLNEAGITIINNW